MAACNTPSNLDPQGPEGKLRKTLRVSKKIIVPAMKIYGYAQIVLQIIEFFQNLG